MSNPLKKIAKAIKKVFKKVVKVVKKIVKSKLFKVVLLAAAVYFTAGAAGAFAGSAAAPISTATALAPASTGAALTGSVGGSLHAAAATAASTTAASGGIMSTIGATAKGALGWAKANPLLASKGLEMGGAMLSGFGNAKAKEDAAEDERRRLKDNNSTYLDVYGGTMNSLSQSGFSREASPTNQYASVKNTQAKAPQFFDNSSNTWKAISAKGNQPPASPIQQVAAPIQNQQVA